jgi:hypothetical protein
MKKLLIILLLPFFVRSQNSKMQGKAGFENYVFGTAPTEYKNLTLEIDEGGTKLYSATPTTQLPGVQVSDLNITFLKNQLSTVSLRTKNSTGQKLLQTLKENYGEPSKQSAAKGTYEWVGDKLHLVYELNKNSSDATASFYSKEVYNKSGKK